MSIIPSEAVQKKLYFILRKKCFLLMPYLILRKCNDIGKLLAPPYFIKERLITDIFTCVTVQPPLLRRRIDFCPDMVYSTDKRATERKEIKVKFIKPE